MSNTSIWRSATLTRALREAKRAGFDVAGATLTPDGGVTLTFSQAGTSSNSNEWDTVLHYGKN